MQRPWEVTNGIEGAYIVQVGKVKDRGMLESVTSKSHNQEHQIYVSCLVSKIPLLSYIFLTICLILFNT